jgi:lipopolysaccharide export system permease protein
MRILTRYVLAELAKVFSVSLIALTAMMIVVGVVREAANQNLPLIHIVRLLPYILPDALRFTIPMSLLLAATSAYGRLSGSNEVLATKAAGISPMTILWPAFAAAFLISLVTVWLNDVAVSWGRNGMKRVAMEAFEDIIYTTLKARPSYTSPAFAIIARVKDRQLINPTLSVPAQGNKPGLTVTAEKAELQSDREEGVLKIILYNAQLDVDGAVPGTALFPDVYEYEVPLGGAKQAQRVSNHPSWLPLRVIPDEIAEQKETIGRLDLEMAAVAAHQMLAGDFDALTNKQWRKREETREGAFGRLCRLKTEPHRRWSAGFSCLCFVWVGAPMAIRLRNRDFLTSFFLCFLPILIVYYPLLAYGMDGAKSGTIPPYAVWAGNILLACWGAWLLKRVVQY